MKNLQLNMLMQSAIVDGEAMVADDSSETLVKAKPRQTSKGPQDL